MKKEDFLASMDAEWQPNGTWKIGKLSDRYDLKIAESMGCGPSGRLDHGYYLFYYASILSNNSRILEIGTAGGGSAICMGMGIRGKDNIILTIDPGMMSDKEIQDRKSELGMYGGIVRYTLDQVSNHIRIANLEGYIIPIPDTSENVLKRWDGRQIDMLFVDGSHTYKDVQTDCQWMKYVKKGGIAVFDDWIEPVEKGVRNYIRDHPEMEWEMLTTSTAQPPGKPWKTVYWKN